MTRHHLTALRDQDFADCLRRVVADSRNSGATSSRLIDLALACRPRRYYLNYATVSQTLVRLRREGLPTGPVDDHVLGRWIDINNAVNRYIALHRHATLQDAITHVITFERPSRFYIPPRRAVRIFRSIVRPRYALAS